MNHWPENHSPDSVAAASPAGGTAAEAPSHAGSGQASAPLSRRARLGLVAGWGLALVAIVAVALMGRSQLQLREQMAQNLARLGSQTRDLSLQLQLATQQGEQMRARAALLEEKVAAFDARRSQADAVLQTLANSQQSIMLADMRASLQTAQQQAQLTGNVQPLLLTRAEAEQRLVTQRQPRLVAAHQAVVQDLAKLRSTPALDVTQVLADLDHLLQRVDALPLQGNAIPSLQAAPTSKKPVALEPQSRWLRLWQSVKESMMQLVRVRTVSSTSAALIAPEQTVYVREHLRQRLLNARMALLVRQSDAARRDLDAAATLLDQYFDGQTPAVQSAQQTLQQVAQQARMSEPPGIARALQALAAAEEHTAAAAIPAAPASAASH